MKTSRGPHSGRRLVVQPDEVRKFWRRVRKGAECWKWTGPINSMGGYGMMNLRCVGRGPAPAHRVAYTIVKGAIPEGLCVMHTCDNPPCVNPDHLVLGTHQDNMADMDAKGRRSWHEGPIKTHCLRGHLRFGAKGQCPRCVSDTHKAETLARQAEWMATEQARLAPYLPADPDELESKMSFRHAAVLKSCYGLYGVECMTMQDIADVLGVSRQRVDQLRDKALHLLGASHLAPSKPHQSAPDGALVRTA
jgi:hypothetical protein